MSPERAGALATALSLSRSSGRDPRGVPDERRPSPPPSTRRGACSTDAASGPSPEAAIGASAARPARLVRASPSSATWLLPRRRRRGRRPRPRTRAGDDDPPARSSRDLVVEGVLRGAEAHRGALVNIKTYTRGRGQLPQLQFLPFSSWYFSSADFQPLG